MAVNDVYRLGTCLTILSFQVVSCNRGQDGDGKFISAENPAILLSGRWDRSDPKHPQASWPGFGVSTDFTGTSIRVQLRDAGNFYNVEIDGKPSGAVGGERRQTTTYTLASGLEAGMHHLCLRRRNISFETPTVLDGFIVDRGASLSPSKKNTTLAFEFIGDSYTAAEGNEAQRATLPWLEKYPVTNFDQGFAAQIATACGAEITAVCRSGSGLVCDYTGKRNQPMGERYGWTLMENSEPRWDFSATSPDLVLICLGLNDFGGLKKADGRVSESDSATFRAAYIKLIDIVRKRHPQAKMIAISPHLPWLIENIQKVVTEEMNSGHRDVHYVHFDYFPNGYVADGHPTVETHQKIAAQILSQLRALKLVPQDK
jgi:Carbohydrate esterase 2 N-terminal/GDSL-like Lipase/Acylhydrolase family